MLTGLLLSLLLLQPPATAPLGDAEIDWLMQQALPTSSSTTQPITDDEAATTSPLSRPSDVQLRPGTITLSDGRVIAGVIATTRDKPVRVWDEAAGKYHDVPFELVRAMEAIVLWEREEREWQFKESGSDIKVYTGRTYPARETAYVVTLVNDQQIRGTVTLPLTVTSDAGSSRHFLHKRAKGEPGQTLKELVYVRRVDFK
jgi:hypothetical protein